jgi:predicted nucleotidyltransferase
MLSLHGEAMAITNLADLRIDPSLRAALKAVRDRLTAQFDVDRIVIFGSAVWGTRDEESDVDMLIVLKERPDLATEDRISQVIFEINLDYDTNLSEMIVDCYTWDYGVASAMPIHEEIEKRGIRL